jgi:hypothetical protein
VVGPRWQGKTWHHALTELARVPRDGPSGPHSLVPSRAAARTRYNRQASLARHCLPDSLPAWLYLRRGAISATLAMFNTRYIRPTIRAYPTRAAKVRYKVEVAGCNNPWAASMRPYMQHLLGTDSLEAKNARLTNRRLGEKHVRHVQQRDQTALLVLRGARPTTASRYCRYHGPLRRMDRGTWHN